MSESKEIRFVDLSVGYGKKQVLKHISMNLEFGKIHGIFGRNGCGKTTLLKSLAGLLPCIKGNILIDSISLKDIDGNEIAKKMAVVLTSRPGISNMSVADYIAYGRYPYTNWLGMKTAADDSIIAKAMEDCGLIGFEFRDLNELSDGEMQKVQIARALAQNAEILLLDEPASHLDLVNKAEIFHLLKKICKEGGKTILFTSHDIQFALQLSDDFILIHKGQVVKYDVNEFIDNKAYTEILDSPYLDFDAGGNHLKFKSSI